MQCCGQCQVSYNLLDIECHVAEIVPMLPFNIIGEPNLYSPVYEIQYFVFEIVFRAETEVEQLNHAFSLKTRRGEARELCENRVFSKRLKQNMINASGTRKHWSQEKQFILLGTQTLLKRNSTVGVHTLQNDRELWKNELYKMQWIGKRWTGSCGRLAQTLSKRNWNARMERRERIRD